MWCVSNSITVIFMYLIPRKLLTLILLMWRIWLAPNNASKWQMGFNSAFKGLMQTLQNSFYYIQKYKYCKCLYSFTLCREWKESKKKKKTPIYVQQDVTLRSLFISGNCSTCFGWYFHPSSGAHTTVSTTSGICHTITATCRYSGR